MGKLYQDTRIRILKSRSKMIPILNLSWSRFHDVRVTPGAETGMLLSPS